MAFVGTASASAVRRAAPVFWGLGGPAFLRVSSSVPVFVAAPAGRGLRPAGLPAALRGGNHPLGAAGRSVGATAGSGVLRMAARASPGSDGGASAPKKGAGGASKKAAAKKAATKPKAATTKAAPAKAASTTKRSKAAPAARAAAASSGPRRALVIVESPAKARTIQRILGGGGGGGGANADGNAPPRYIVESCVGHVRDLPSSAKQIPAAVKGEPWARLGVDVANGFRPLYVLMPKKSKIIAALRAQLADCDELVLATDEDREGEAIAWHLVQLLKPDKLGVPVQRAVFHEITPAAVTAAFASMRAIDEHLVSAQETRRVLDRLAGYTMSPLLWQKISRGLSAGRVQSVAMTHIVRREHRRLAFVRADYAGAKAVVAAGGGAFEVSLVALAGRRLATGKDFDPSTGRLWADADARRARQADDGDAADVDDGGAADGDGDGDSDGDGGVSRRKKGGAAAASAKPPLQLKKTAAKAVVKALTAADGWAIDDVTRRGTRRRPPPPFITSTLQQESSRRLGMPAAKTMRVAQGLYERGLLTYMRTDNPTLSEQAVAATRSAIVDRYGGDHLGAGRVGAKPKSAQEAHEAIRPAGEVFLSPAEAGLEGDEARLYALVYRRTLASQMADAAVDTTTITVRSPPLPPPLLAQIRGGKAADGAPPAAEAGDDVGIFRASGTIVVFPGFLAVYSDAFGAHAEGGAGEADGGGDGGGAAAAGVSPSAASARPGTAAAAAQVLPDVVPGAPTTCSALDVVQHTTIPPARYTDASLVKELEALGVGRPSTYASIVETLVLRGYVTRGTRETAGRLPPQALAPRLTAFVVDQLLSRYFPSFVDAAFTADMERSLDAIAAGAADRQEYLASYYLGEGGLAASVARMEKEIDTAWARRLVLPGQGGGAGTADGGGGKRSAAAKKKDVARGGGGLAAGAEVFVGPYGPYIELPRGVVDAAAAAGGGDAGREVIKASLPAATLADELSAERLEQILSRALDPVIGTDPATGLDVLVRTGRYGPYVQLGRDVDYVPEEKPKRKVGKKGLAAAAAAATAATAPSAADAADTASPPADAPALTADGKRVGKPKRASLLPGMDVGDVNLPTALRILSLPRLLGVHPTLGGEVKAGMGRFGPYVVHNGVFVSLKSTAAAAAAGRGGAGASGGDGGDDGEAPHVDALAADDSPAIAGDNEQWRQVLTVGLDEAVALLDKPRPPRRAFAADKAKRVKAAA